MNKISLVSMPLPVTSAILVYNLGLISPVKAQDKSVIHATNSDIASQFDLTKNQLGFNYPQDQLSNLDLSLLSGDRNYNVSVGYTAITNNITKGDLTANTITNIPPEPILYPLTTEATSDRELDFFFTINNEKKLPKIKSIANIHTSDRSLDFSTSVNLESFKVKANKSTILNSNLTEIPNTASNFQLSNSSLKNQSKSDTSITANIPITWETYLKTNASLPTTNNFYDDTSPESVLIPHSLNIPSLSSNTETTFIDNELNQTLKQIEQYNQQNLALESFNKVSSLKDVQTTDWAYNALIRLVENYGCIEGYEDNTFRGNRTITRYEFAAALSRCLQSIKTLATDNQNNQSTASEFAELEKLQADFKQELLAVQTKTDNLEQQVTFLEDQNFSPTTILRGRVDFLLASAFGDQKAVPSGETPSEDLADQVTFSSRIQLNFETSFTGRDLLRTRLQGGNINAFGTGVTGTQMTFLGTTTNTDNEIQLGQIFYRYPLGDKGNVYVAGAQQSSSAFIPTLNRASSISLFGFNNPIFDLGFGAGGGIYYQFNDFIGAGATYFSGSPSNSESGKGFFNGDFSALGQVTVTPSDALGISFTYARFFSPEPGNTNNVTSFTGSQFAQLPFGGDTPTSSDNFNMALSYQVSDRLELSGWIGYLNANAQSSPANSGFIDLDDASADIWSGAIAASYNDLGKLGSKLSLIVGVPPKLTDNDLSEREDDDTALHLELSYNYPFTEKISLIPGVLAITNPEHNNDNDTIVVGLLQTTFSF